MALTYSGSKKAVLTLTVVAAMALEVNRAVDQDGNYSTAGAACFGFTDTAGDVGEQTSIDCIGTSYATSGAAIDVDELLEVGTDGKLIPLDTGKVVARAMSATTGANESLDIFILPANS
jgi:hypothetical protein